MAALPPLYMRASTRELPPGSAAPIPQKIERLEPLVVNDWGTNILIPCLDMDDPGLRCFCANLPLGCCCVTWCEAHRILKLDPTGAVVSTALATLTSNSQSPTVQLINTVFQINAVFEQVRLREKLALRLGITEFVYSRSICYKCCLCPCSVLQETDSVLEGLQYSTPIGKRLYTYGPLPFQCCFFKPTGPVKTQAQYPYY